MLALGLALWALWDVRLEAMERSGLLWTLRVPRHSSRVAGMRTRRIDLPPVHLASECRGELEDAGSFVRPYVDEGPDEG